MSRAVRALAIVRGVRPAHAWKNVPVVAALLFGHRATDPSAALATVGAFLAFALVSGAGYLVNDVADREADRRDATRARRPVAAGDLSVGAALGAAAVLAGGTLVLAGLLLPRGVLVALAAYLALTLLYTFLLRRVGLLGLLAVSAGFVLRAAGGAAAAEVAPSPWLLVLTGVLALALAVAKRETEARRREVEPPRGLSRTTDALLLASALGYVAWTQSPDTVALHGTRALGLTAVPVVLALARFRSRLRGGPRVAGPAEVVARDPVLLALGALWALLCAGILYA